MSYVTAGSNGIGHIFLVVTLARGLGRDVAGFRFYLSTVCNIPQLAPYAGKEKCDLYNIS